MKLDRLLVTPGDACASRTAASRSLVQRLDAGRGAGAGRVERGRGAASLEALELPPRRAARAGGRHRLRAAEQAFAALAACTRGRAALHAGALSRSTGFVCEFNITGSLWTSRVTSHVPLKDVASHITPQACATR
jgi:4-hydroxythreonine-4-phosphate dehydrogenase